MSEHALNNAPTAVLLHTYTALVQALLQHAGLRAEDVEAEISHGGADAVSQITVEELLKGTRQIYGLGTAKVEVYYE